MKKNVFILLVSLLAVSLNTNAQPQMPSAKERAEHETEMMKTELSLDSEQVEKVAKINLKYAEKMDEMFQQGPGGDFSEMEKKMEDIEAKKRNELKEILNTEQLKKYDEMVEERKKNRPGPPPQR